jgi:signal transduction histidine kinase
VIEVVDTGSGIEPEHLPRVFDRFYRVNAARTRDGEGTGLGLPIARTLVQAHGGELTLTSKPGEGTRATVRLKAVADEPEQIGREVREAAKAMR